MTQNFYEDVATKLAANMSATRPNTAMDVVRVTDLSGTTLAVNFDVRVEQELLRITSITVDGGGSGIDRWTASHLGGAAASTHAKGQEVEAIVTAHALNNDLVATVSDDDSAYMPTAGGTFTGAVEFENDIVDDTENAGSNGDVLTKVSGHPRWAAGSSGSLSGLSDVDLTEGSAAKGDILIYNLVDSKWERLAVGPDTDVLTADSTQELGVKWAAGGGGGSGASTADHFVVGQGGEADTDLSAKIIIPGLSGSPDIRVAGAHDAEFDAAAGGASFNALTSFDEDVTALSHLFMKQNSNGGADAFKGYILPSAGLATPFTVTAKVLCAGIPGQGIWPVLFVTDSATAAGNAVGIGPFDGRQRYLTVTNLQTLAGLAGAFVETLGSVPFRPMWLKLIVHSTTNVDAQYSYDGITWATAATALNPGLGGTRYAGVAVDAFSSAAQLAVDWIRFS